MFYWCCLRFSVGGDFFSQGFCLVFGCFLHSFIISAVPLISIIWFILVTFVSYGLLKVWCD